MGQLRFKYVNQIKEGTIYGYTSQISYLPATNVQKDIIAKYWKTDTTQPFCIYSGNFYFPFRDTSTGSVKAVSLASGTYTGSGLASILESGMNSVGDYSNHYATYNEATGKFIVGRSSTSTGLFQMAFTDGTYSAQNSAYILGYDRTSYYSGSAAYSGSITYGNENEIIVEFTSTASVTSFIVDGHDLSSGSVLKLRFADTASVFRGPWNQTATIVKSATLTFNSGIISTDFTATTPKAVQFYFGNRSATSSYIGMLYAGPYRTFQYHTSAPVDFKWERKEIPNRTRYFTTDGGATLFDKKARIREWEISVDPLDEYYNSGTITIINEIYDRVGNETPFYITFDPNDQSQTVFGFIVTDWEYERMRGTPVLQLNNFVIREQK